jgi:hypothetical protein
MLAANEYRNIASTRGLSSQSLPPPGLKPWFHQRKPPEALQPGVQNEHQGEPPATPEPAAADPVDTVEVATDQVELRRDRDRILVVTYSDRVTAGLCLSMASAASQGFELHVLGISGQKFEDVDDPKLKKVYGMQNFMEDKDAHAQISLDDEDILVFADAGDVVYVGSIDEALQSFHEIIGSGHEQIVVAAERNCWPYMDGETERIPGGRILCAEYPKKSSFRYLNAGAYAGRVKHIRSFLKILSSTIPPKSASDDQLFFQQLYTKQVREGRDPTFQITPDHRSRLFQTGHLTHLETALFAKPEPNGAYFDIHRKRVINSETGSKPFLVHFNGEKVAFEPIARSVISALGQSAILDEYRSKHEWYEGQCGPHLRPA